MVVECWAIILLIVIIAYVISRTGRAGQAVAILPLITVPVFHLLGGPSSRFIGGLFSVFSKPLIRVSFDVAGLVVACVLYGLLAGNMGSRGGRRVYMILCGGFSALLVIVLIGRILAL
ncbi:MAG: hypothetical protein RSB36_01230 [Hydrogenoanaerobacterium sp.]